MAEDMKFFHERLLPGDKVSMRRIIGGKEYVLGVIISEEIPAECSLHCLVEGFSNVEKYARIVEVE